MTQRQANSYHQKVGNEILKSLGLSNFGATFVSCPTCGRTRIYRKLPRRLKKNFATSIKKSPLREWAVLSTDPMRLVMPMSELRVLTAKELFSARGKFCAKFPKLNSSTNFSKKLIT